MAQRLPRGFFALLATVFLLLVAERSVAQDPPPPPPVFGNTPKTPEPPPAPKELSALEIDGLIEKAFGKDCPELKLPVRIWLAHVGMVIVAKEASITRSDGTATFLSASLALTTETQVLRGEQIIIRSGIALTKVSDLNRETIVGIEVRRGGVKILLTPRSDANATFGEVGTKIGSARVPPPPVEPKSPEGPADPLLKPGDGRVLGALTSRIALAPSFRFEIDAKASLPDLLPKPLKTASKSPLWTNEDLAKVAELTFGEPIAKDLSKFDAMQGTAHVMAKINHLNGKKRDGFMLALIDKRDDLRGLPFLMGDDCKTREEQARIFASLAESFHPLLGQAKREKAKDGDELIAEVVGEIHAIALADGLRDNGKRFPRASQEEYYRATVAVLTQIFMPEPASSRLGLVKTLTTIPHVEATKGAR